LPSQKARGCLNPFNFLEKNAVEETGEEERDYPAAKLATGLI
jgi:hypothetical protein